MKTFEQYSKFDPYDEENWNELKIPNIPGFYWARVQDEWEPVSVFNNPTGGFGGVILVGSNDILSLDEVNEMIDKFGDKLIPPE